MDQNEEKPLVNGVFLLEKYPGKEVISFKFLVVSFPEEWFLEQSVEC